MHKAFEVILGSRYQSTFSRFSYKNGKRLKILCHPLPAEIATELQNKNIFVV